MKRAQTFSGRNASQVESELKSFIAFLKKQGVKSYMEVGARDGDTFHAVMCSLPMGSKGVAVDLPGGLWGKQSSLENLKKAVDDLNARGYDCRYIMGDSKNPDIIRKISDLGPYDAVFIDGDHTLAGVSEDWNNFHDMAPIIAFHDISGSGQKEKVSGQPVEVPRLWQWIKNERSLEFIEEGSPMGIGVFIHG